MKLEGKLHQSLEQEIVELGQEVERHKKDFGSSLERRELLKKSLQSVVFQRGNGETKAKKVDLTESDTAIQSPFLPEYLKEEDLSAETALLIKALLDMVFHKGLVRALKESKKYPPFIQDAFHDSLTEKLIPEMEKRNLL